MNFFNRKLSESEKTHVRFRGLQILLGCLLGLLLAAFVIVWQYGRDEWGVSMLKHKVNEVVTDQAVPPNGAPIGGAFTMTDQNGKTISNSDYLGKYMLVYFGYTYCPDMCPTGLQSMAHALDQLGDGSKKIAALFVTIDPDRDTAAKLKEYDASFHPDIVGLRGTSEQTAAMAKAYQVYYARGEDVDDGDYLMDHSTLIYLMGPDGKFITTFPEEVDPATIVKTLQSQWHETAP